MMHPPHHPIAITSRTFPHCPLHARDFSDCLVHHVPWPPHCFSTLSVLDAITKQALQQNPHKKECRVSRYPSVSNLIGKQKQKGKQTFDPEQNPKNCSKSDINDNGSDFQKHGKTKAMELDARRDASSARRVKNCDSSHLSFTIAKSCSRGRKNISNSFEDSATLGRCSSAHDPQSKVLLVDSRQYPWDMLGGDLVLKIFSFLDARSLARCGAVSKGWQVWAFDDSLWSIQCNILWEGKAHLPRMALQEGLPKVTAYSISVKDSKRTRITINDLCDHAWEFRFKSTSPEYWLNLDPSWHGEPPMQRYFHFDGSQTAGPDDAVWGGHECCYYIVDVPSFNGDYCRFVRINHWPLMRVSRTQNWGWELQNEIYVYNSISDSWKDGGTGPMHSE